MKKMLFVEDILYEEHIICRGHLYEEDIIWKGHFVWRRHYLKRTFCMMSMFFTDDILDYDEVLCRWHFGLWEHSLKMTCLDYEDAGLGFCSFAHRSFAHLLKSLRTNERMWAIFSGTSGQMSEWANRSFFLSKSVIFLFAHKKWAIRSKKFEKIVFLYVFTVKKEKDLLISSERRSERIAQVAQG